MSSTSLNPCACSQPTFHGADGKYSTNCDADTKRTFAPGHDARLKGYLIRAAIADEKVSVGTKTMTPMDLANLHGFGYMVQAGIDLAAAKASAPRKERKAKAPSDAPSGKAKSALPAKPKMHLAEAATAKVGRWVKHGMYNHDERTFTYTDARGNQITLPATKYTNLELG